MKPFALCVALCLAVAGCTSGPATVTVAVDPVPYTMAVPADVATRLSTGPLSDPFRQEAEAAGVSAATTVYYQPRTGTRTILMTVYHFPADKFDQAQNPDEPPPFGKQVLRDGGFVLSVAGPHDTIFDEDSPDGRDVVAMQRVLYLPKTYTRTN